MEACQAEMHTALQAPLTSLSSSLAVKVKPVMHVATVFSSSEYYPLVCRLVGQALLTSWCSSLMVRHSLLCMSPLPSYRQLVTGLSAVGASRRHQHVASPPMACRLFSFNIGLWIFELLGMGRVLEQCALMFWL